MPLISIITINYNNAAGLERTINSVCEQRFDDFEYIVIDGGSADNSCDIIRLHEKEISFWSSESDSGVYHAMNKGISRASGDYCLFLNSGDYLANDSVLKGFSDLKIVCDIVAGNAIVDLGRNGTELVKSPENISFYTFYKHSILHQATFIKRSLFGKFGLYNQNLRIVGDWEFFIRVLCIGNCHYQSIPQTISVFDSKGMSSLPQNMKICSQEREQVLNKYFATFLPDYKLIKDRPVYDFLKKLDTHTSLGKIILFILRVLNKVIPG